LQNGQPRVRTGRQSRLVAKIGLVIRFRGLQSSGLPITPPILASFRISGMDARCYRVAACFLVLAWTAVDASAQQSKPASNNSPSDGPQYLLRYKLKPNAVLRYEVTHLGQTKTRIQGKEEVTETRSVSTKRWNVTDVNDQGEMTFENLVEAVELSQKLNDSSPIVFNSRTDSEPPPQFLPVVETIGKPLTTIRVNPQGQVRERKDQGGMSGNSLGMGELTIPMPAEPLSIGGRWTVPRDIQVRTDGGEVKKIKIHEVYTLEQVQTGIATLSVKSQPITPVDDPALESQLVQQLSNGKIKFDLDAGYVLEKQLDWQATVVGFRGADSMLEYLARLTENFVAETSATTRAAGRSSNNPQR
jgi:hypothetical protein